MAIVWFSSIPIVEYSDETLLHWKKKELIEYIRQLEHSVKNLDERLDVQARNMLKYELVGHSHWKQYQDLSGETFPECAHCGLVWWLDEGTAEENEMYYCPKCGFKMDEEVE